MVYSRSDQVARWDILRSAESNAHLGERPVRHIHQLITTGQGFYQSLLYKQARRPGRITFTVMSANESASHSFLSLHSSWGFLYKQEQENFIYKRVDTELDETCFIEFLLTQLLLEVLEKSPSARIINLSSAMHKRGGKPDFSDFQLEKIYSPDKAYGLSKLYLIWITRHQAKQLKERGMTNVTINASHPGAVATNFGQDADKGFLINLIFRVAMRFMDKPEQGARTSVYLATSPEVEKVTGKFFGSREKEEQPDAKYYSEENEKKVWDYCMSIVQPYL